MTWASEFQLDKIIEKRKSCRSFTGIPVDGEMLEKIMSAQLQPLYPQIKVRWDVVSRDKVKCLCPWTTPQLITVYSEEAEGFLENVGFLFQQMELYLQSLGLGVCWLGMGRLNPRNAPQVEGMRYVIMLAFGHPKGELLRKGAKDFRRKPMAQITDREDARLECARLAPSSVNSQPWYFTHEGERIHVYCAEKGMAKEMNRIDMGIALAHLYVTNEKSFRFSKEENVPAVPGLGYIGTVDL